MCQTSEESDESFVVLLLLEVETNNWLEGARQLEIPKFWPCPLKD